MKPVLISPANAEFLGISGNLVATVIPLVGIGLFIYIISRRLAPLRRAAADPRLDSLGARLFSMLKYAVAQYRQPRYMMAGVLHIMLFAGFMILSVRSLTLVIIGIWDGFAFPGLGGDAGHIYNVLKDIAATMVLLAAVIAMVRRGIFKPERYDVPPRYGKSHTWEAVFVLCLITTLVTCDFLFEGALMVAMEKNRLAAEFVLPATGTWFAKNILADYSLGQLQTIHLGAYFLHEVVFFFFLCFLPLGKHFHVITSLPNVFLMKLQRGTVKPVLYNVEEETIEQLESIGVKQFEDFTWKHMLDFYSCADCGRCSDNCPANAVGRPLSPRFISIKCRDYGFNKYTLWGASQNGKPLLEKVLEEDEIWSCTTCGACEQECPLMIQYIDKIVDVRRGMVDDGNVPQSLQKPLRALEKRGNPYGKMEKKRADWTKLLAEEQNGPVVKILDGKKQRADTLFFADSITSYDDRIQEIGRAAARVLQAADIDFGILGKAEKDSGHEVRRFGEEMLFMQLRDQNIDAIAASGVKRIVTADPHAFNAFKNDYNGSLPPVEHISRMLARCLDNGKLRLKPIEDRALTFTFHDPCYLGRHNGLYDVPRNVLDAIPGIKRVEMSHCRDRSFCCGGGGLMLFYEPVEDTRMGRLRVEMAKKAGANVIVTACPFCMVNMEDAIKTSGLEGRMQAIDLVELVDQQLLIS